MSDIDQNMNSNKPYLIRAIHEWILDNEATPLIIVNTNGFEVKVPTEFIADDGTITFNLSTSAVRNLVMDNESISFNARFNGTPRSIYIPTEAVKAIYARENGQGMVFSEHCQEEEIPPQSPTDSHTDNTNNSPRKTPTGSRPQLRIVK